MRRGNTARYFVLALTSAMLSPGCATLTRSRQQIVPVTSSPPGAEIIVNGVRKGVTPKLILLSRKVKDQTIRIECPGYNPFEIRMIRDYSSFHVLANGVLGFVVGAAVAGAWHLGHDETAPDSWACIGTAIGGFLMIDVASRAGYALTPKDLTVTLTKAVGPPRIDTIVLEADDLRNVKWIRIHLVSSDSILPALISHRRLEGLTQLIDRTLDLACCRWKEPFSIPSVQRRRHYGAS